MKKDRKKNIFFLTEFLVIIKINAAKQGFYFLMCAGYYERKIYYTWLYDVTTWLANNLNTHISQYA